MEIKLHTFKKTKNSNKMKKTGIELITEERESQIVKHGRTIEMDAELNKGQQLSDAATILASPVITTPRKRLSLMPVNWDDTIALHMCKKPYKERLVIAGALIAAELDRIMFNDALIAELNKEKI